LLFEKSLKKTKYQSNSQAKAKPPPKFITWDWPQGNKHNNPKRIQQGTLKHAFDEFHMTNKYRVFAGLSTVMRLQKLI